MIEESECLVASQEANWVAGLRSEQKHPVAVI